MPRFWSVSACFRRPPYRNIDVLICDDLKFVKQMAIDLSARRTASALEPPCDTSASSVVMRGEKGSATAVGVTVRYRGQRAKAVSRHCGSTFGQCAGSRARGEVNTPQETLLNPRGSSLEGFRSVSTSIEPVELRLGAAQFPPLSHGYSTFLAMEGRTLRFGGGPSVCRTFLKYDT